LANVLLVDDDRAFADATSQLLSLLGHAVDVADSVKEAQKHLADGTYDRIFLDLMLPDGSGFHLLDYVPNNSGRTKVTIITGHPSVKKHVMSLYGMNVNYLIKPIDFDQLKRLFEGDERSRDQNVPKKHFGELIGESPVMHRLYGMIQRVASSDANVMLMGERGVGKGVVARAIHNAGRTQGPMVAANCGAFAPELIGSELFGHEKGAFTGAIARKEGLFEQAENGTLFLDEITEMPVTLQPTLLRVLETQMVTRVGGTGPLPVKCRVISATNRTENQIVDSNCLREDIYYRLAVFPIHIPPLRERVEDIPLLVQSFLYELNSENGTAFGIREEDIQKLLSYDWPGNVRELRHTIHRAYIMSNPSDKTLRIPDDFCSPFSRRREAPKQTALVGRTIDEVEKELIMETLRKYNNNKTKAAEVLGVSVKTLYNRLSSYGADNEDKTGKTGS